MRKVILFLTALLTLFACKKDTAIFNSNPLLYKDYISGFTSGIVSAETSFKLLFNEAISQEKIAKINDLDLFEVSPKVKGKVICLNPYEVEFIPEKRLEQDTEYKVSFNLKKLFSVSEGLEIFNFSIKTLQQGYKIKEGDLQSYNENLYFLNAELLSSDKISYEKAKKIISAKLGNKKIAVKFLSQSSSNKFSIVFDSIPRLDNEQTLQVSWNANDVPSENLLPFSTLIPEKGSFKAISAKTESSSNQSFSINFSEPLEKNQNFNGLVNLSNTDTELKYSVNGNVLKVFREASDEGDFQVFVNQGIRSVYGKRIDDSKTFDISFLQQKPEIRLVKNGTILPSSQNLKIHFQAINLRAVNAVVYRIYENNILQFLQENSLGSNYGLQRVGKPIAKKVIQLSENALSPLKEWNTYSLDLSSVITPEPGAIYRVEFTMKKNYSLYACGSENEPLDLSFEEEPLENEPEDYEEDYYYWGSSDNPCDDYFYNKTLGTNVLASDLGVIVKKGQNNNYVVVVNDILSTQPVSGAVVEVFDYQQQKIQEGKTDGDGIVKFDISNRAFFAKVKKDNNTTYIKMDDAAPQSVSKYDVDGLRLQKGLNGFIYAERGVWRPGDSIHVGFVLNDFAQKLPEKLPIKLKFTDPYGKVIAERVQSSNPVNHYVFGLKTSPEAPTGNWNVSISVGAAKFNKSIKIETIKPNRLKIENSLNEKLISANGANANLQVLWLHGSPAGNTQVSVKAKFYPKETAFKGYEKYIFNNEAYQFENQEISVYEGRTDSQGKTNFYFKANELQAPGMLRVNFLTQANESGGDFSTDVTTASFSPYESYVGLRLPEANKYDYYNTEENHIFEVAALSENGEPLRGQNVSVTVYKVGWNWWWDASNQNISTYNSSSSNAIYTTKVIETDGRGKAKFDLKIPDEDWGRYFILLSDEQSGHKSGTTVYFDWGSWSGKSRKASSEEAIMLSLGSNKKEYNVGEKAKISFPSDEGGRALISVENGNDVLETYWVETKSAETSYEIPITEKMAPNVYLYVTLLQPHANSINDAPIRLYGVLPISVVDKETQLNPVIQMADVLRPKQKTTVKISEKSGKPMTYTLAIVEDGLLNLTRFKTPDPWNKFFSKTALGVKTWDVYNDVVGAYGGTVNQAFSIGGDEDLGGADAQKANRFKPFVIVKGPYNLKKGNTNVHDVEIPNYIGSARVMVVASDVAKNAFGSAEKKDIPVVSPLSLLGSLPRKAVPGERITLPVTVFAMEKSVRNATISVETNTHFKIVGNKSQSLQFDSAGEKMAYFELEVAQQVGIGKVKITAVSGGEKATYEVEMDVYNPNPVTYFVQNAVLTEGSTQSLNTPIFGENAKSVLEISSFPGVNLHQRLNYLISYPHGCGEQITSGAFPQLFLSDFINLTPEKVESVQRNVTTAISKLHENQLPNGGFAYWKGNSYADDWATSYIGHFFISAEKKGYVLPSGSKQNWLDYQNNEARQWRYEPQYQNDFAQAYRLYTLALAGEPNMGAMNRLRETKDISSNSKRLLSASYAIAGQKQTANNLFQSVAVDDDYDNYYYYGSEVRNKAMALETALLIGKKEDAARWALEIANRLSSSDWMSTQTTAYALYAMAKYVEVNKSGKSFSVSYSLRGKTENIKSDEPMTSVELPVKGDKELLQVKNTSKQTLYARLISSGVLPVGKELPMQNGLAITTTYRDKNGNWVDVSQLRQSTELIASIEVKNLTNEPIENVALTQIIPSGWEIINTRFTDYGDTEQSSYIDYTDFRDDRANFYFPLKGNQVKVIKLKINASYAGRYYLPGTFAEAMYNNRYNTRTEGKWVEVYRGE
ncbi:membrane protein [Capnocytophaga cynodegmi]|uniref:alpha-2-macroglobulin family protein n=1 Tax=Capnocytophaga cynodegmi TaxID=28189 RepID=UPI001EE2CE8B|nr:MG2 domain-containing protein [Capnocytophaga cynodegmi]GJQ06907.1 membrane protein [Capnocytophaga cynodegmi]